MMVTDIVRDEQIYENNEWTKTKPDIIETLEKYNNNIRRFQFYLWGIFVTAYARRNLFSGILEFSNDYIYADTDSIKAVNMKNHLSYIESYNKNCIIKLQNSMAFHGLDMSYCSPKTINGIEKPLGVWDNEGDSNWIAYKKFKALGAKRYMIYDGEKLNITVSGINKKIAVPYILDQNDMDIDKCFKFFSNGMYIPIGKCGKNTHTYIDEEKRGIVKDYKNNYYEFYSPSGIHLSESDYHLSLAREYVELLLGIKDSTE